MRLGFSPSRALTVAVLFAAGVATGVVARPLAKDLLMWWCQDRYAALVRNCDQSMREHFIAKMNVAQRPGEDTVDNLEAAEIGLIACQDYDLFQKRLIKWGLSENELSEMRLEAVEAGATSLREVVSEHEIRY